jgi:hypothetical protein
VNESDTSGLRQAVARTPECLTVEQMSSDTLTPRERDHLDGCARCQTEQALWREFDGAEPTADEGAAVQWIVAELARRHHGRTPAAPLAPRRWFSAPIRTWAAALAMLAVVITVGYVAWDREPNVRAPIGSADTYRTAGLRAVAPVGDVSTVPTRLEWVAVNGAVGYDVEVLEVDRTPLWRTVTSTVGVELPPTIASILRPGKPLLWQVRARDAGNRVIADSGTQRFRLQGTNTSPKD